MKVLVGVLLACVSLLSQANNLNVADSLKVLTINGQPINQFNDALDLPKGIIILGLRYEELFDLSVEEHKLVRSDIYYLKFDANANYDYQISTPVISVSQAKSFSKSPEFVLKNDQGENIDYQLWSRETLLHKLIAQK